MTSGGIVDKDRELGHDDLEVDCGIGGSTKMAWNGSSYLTSGGLWRHMENLQWVTIETAYEI